MQRFVMDRRRLGRAAGLLVLGLILLATLRPSPGAEPEPWLLCVVCGPRGLADAIANALLFLPLGAALRVGGWRFRVVVGFAALVSLSVEVAQTSIPGRDPSFGDLFFNTFGAAAGAALLRPAARIPRLSPSRSAWWALVAAFGIAAVIGATGRMLQVAPLDLQLFGWLSPRGAPFEESPGHVLEARIGEFPIASRPFADSREVGRAIRRGALLEMQAVIGSRPARPTSLLRIYDAEAREIVIVGRNADDLLVRFRSRAADWRLDQPSLRWEDAFRGVEPGTVVAVQVRAEGRGYCIAIDSAERCGFGFSPASGWSLVFFTEGISDRIAAGLGLLWIAGFGLAFGIMVRPRWPALAGGLVVLVAFAVLPHLVGLLPPPPAQWVALLMAVALGVGLGLQLRSEPEVSVGSESATRISGRRR